MKGRAWLFSALIAVLTRPLLMEGENAEADPARRAAVRAKDFMVVSLFYTNTDELVDLRCLKELG